MIDCRVTGTTLPEAYHNALRSLAINGALVECPDYNTKQLECTITMVVYEPTSEPRISKYIPCGPRELEQYRQEMLDGILDFEIEKGNWAYTYHSRMAEQLPFIVEELKRNPFSRRAVIDIRDWKYDSQNDSPACLQNIQFMIRDGALDMLVLFRSNDACKATFMNAFALTCLQERVAAELGVDVGCYVHRANSFHAYHNDISSLLHFARRSYEEGLDAFTYEYEGDWKDMMEEMKPEISKMVEELKNR